MANPENIEPHKFKAGQTGNKQGRPKKIFSALNAELRAKGYEPATPENVRESFEILLALPLAEVMKIAGSKGEPDNDYPALLRIVASELLSKRRFQIVNSMLDRVHGKSLEKKQIQNEKIVSRYILPDGTALDL